MSCRYSSEDMCVSLWKIRTQLACIDDMEVCSLMLLHNLIEWCLSLEFLVRKSKNALVSLLEWVVIQKLSHAAIPNIFLVEVSHWPGKQKCEEMGDEERGREMCGCH